MDDKEFSDKNFWMVRAGTENELIDSFYEDGLVAVGWAEVGDLANQVTFSDIQNLVEQKYENKNTRQISGCAGQLFRFSHEIDEGDLVLTYNQSSRTYLVGTVTGPYIWDPPTAPESYPHVRQVNWKRMIHRDEFGRFAKNTLGSSLTVFSLDRIEEEIRDLLSTSKADGSTTLSRAQL
jgi:restriction system protein